MNNLPDTDDSVEIITLTVEGGADERRLDQWLVRRLPELTRSRIQALAKQGLLTDETGRTVTKLSAAPRPGTTLALTLPPAEPTGLIPEDIPLEILYEDDALIAIAKPAALVVHPACGHSHGTLANALLHHCPSIAGIGDPMRPGIVHRLDMDTSGVLVAAKTEAARAALVDTFANHRLTKTYTAILHGEPHPRQGTLDTLMGRSPNNRQKMTVLKEGGRRAVTHWNVAATLSNGLCRADIVIETGRTHQIRVHMASLGTPIVGDALYGKPSKDRTLPQPPTRQLLHARRLELPHPLSGLPLTLEAP